MRNSRGRFVLPLTYVYTENMGALNIRERPRMFKAPTKVQKLPQKERNPEVLSFRGRFLTNGRKIIPASVGSKKRPSKDTTHIRLPFVFWWALGAFDFPWAPTEVQSDHFQ